MKGSNYISDSRKEAGKQKRKKGAKKENMNRSRSMVQIMNGDFLTKSFVINNLNYIFFVIFLMVLIVSKGYYVNQLMNDIRAVEREVDDITTDYVEAKAELEEMTTRTQMIQRLTPLGLKETINPTKVIRVKEKEKKKK